MAVVTKKPAGPSHKTGIYSKLAKTNHVTRPENRHPQYAPKGKK